MLTNSLLPHTTDTYWDEFMFAIERLNVPKAIVRLASSYIIKDLIQANVARVVYRLKTTTIDSEVPEVQEAPNTIWRVQSGRDLRGIRKSQGRSAHAHAAEWTPEVGLRGRGTVVEGWSWE